MDFEDTPEEATFRAEVRAWIDANAPKHLEDGLRGAVFGKSPLDADEQLAEGKAWQRKKADAGWACLHWPKEHGGRGASPIERVIWEQEEGVYAGLSGPFLIGHGMCGPTMMAYATEKQKHRYLPPLASGEEIWSQLFSEPGAGSDLAGICTRAERTGDDWVINGQKIWSSGAQHSDYAILITRSDFNVPKHVGLTFFFLSLRSPGIEIRPIKQISGGSEFNEIFFTDVRIPDAHRLGGVGEGWKVSLTTLMNERLAIGSGMSTGLPAFLDLVKDLEDEDGGKLVDDSVLQERIAEWYGRDSGLRNTAFRLITALSKGGIPGPESSISKLVAGRTMQQIASAALDLQGLAGVVSDAQLAALKGRFQFLYLRSCGTRIEGGTDEILRNIIGERVLGLPPDMRADKNLPYSEIPKAP